MKSILSRKRDSKYHFIEDKPEKKIKSYGDIFSLYDIDMDFDFRIHDDGDLLVFIKVSINQVKQPLPGYVIFAEGVAIYKKPNQNEFKERDYNNLVYNSSLSIAINNVRNYITNITTYYPFGKFVLPAIDLNDLHRKKKEQMKKSKSK